MPMPPAPDRLKLIFIIQSEVSARFNRSSNDCIWAEWLVRL